MRRIAIILALAHLVSTGHPLSAQELRERASVKGHPLWTDRVALSPDGKTLATCGSANVQEQLTLWEVSSDEEVATFVCRSLSIEAVAFSPDGRMVAVAGPDLEVWDVATRKPVSTARTGNIDATCALSFSRDGKRLGTAGFRQVRLWDVTSGKEMSSFERPILRVRAAFDRDLRTLARPNYQEIDLWDVDTGKLRETLPERPGCVFRVSFSPDGKTLVATSARYRNRKAIKGDLRLWDVTTGRERAAFLSSVWAIVREVHLSPDGKIVAVLGHSEDDEELAVLPLDVTSGRQRVVRHPPGHSFTSVAFTSDGRLFATGTPDDKAVKLWEVSLPKGEGN
jgi:WD40 repeat protein